VIKAALLPRLRPHRYRPGLCSGLLCYSSNAKQPLSASFVRRTTFSGNKLHVKHGKNHKRA
jgi:hypothetical protein